MRISDEIHLFRESELQQVLVGDKKLCVTSLLALAKSSETAPVTSSASSYCSFQNKGPHFCPCIVGSSCRHWARS